MPDRTDRTDQTDRTGEAERPAAAARQLRRINAFYRALAVVGREQTAALMRQAKAVAEGKAEPSSIKPVLEAELRTTIKHSMVEAFKEGRRSMEKKIEQKLASAPASVRELLTPGVRVLAAVRELDADVLKYGEVAAEYDKWADQVVGSRFRETVDAARKVVTDGLREGVPWQDYEWDKAAGKNTKLGLESRLAKVFRDYETWQLFRVAVTEHTRAVGLGDIYAIDRDKMCVGGRWVVEYTGCPVCNPRDGQVFTTDVLREIHPAHPNCQCMIDPVFEWENAEPVDEAPELVEVNEPKAEAAESVAALPEGKLDTPIELTAQQEGAIRGYTASEFRDVVKFQLSEPPSYLKTEKQLEAWKEKQRQRVVEVREALQKLPPAPGKSWRGLWWNDDAGKEAFMSSIKAGQEYRFRAFQSASRSEEVGGRWHSYEDKPRVTLEITGKTGRDIAPFVGDERAKKEKETLFMPGARFRVANVVGDRVWLEEI